MFVMITEKIWDLDHAVRVGSVGFVGFSNSGLEHKTGKGPHFLHQAKTKIKNLHMVLMSYAVCGVPPRTEEHFIHLPMRSTTKSHNRPTTDSGASRPVRVSAVTDAD